MSVSAQETVFSHVGNGATVTFPYGCQVPQAADLQVYLDDVLVTAGFTVSGIGALTGGVVTFDVPPADGVQVRLERVIALERTTDYQQNGDFLARVVNPDFNRIWMALQQQATALKRALLVPRSEPSGAGLLPGAASRANNLLGFDADGNPVAVAPAAQSATALQGLLAAIGGSTLVGFIHSIVGAIARTMQDKGCDILDARDFGCAADSATDSTAKLLTFFAANAGYRGKLVIPYGTKFNRDTVYAAIPVGCMVWDESSINQGQPPGYKSKVMQLVTRDLVADDTQFGTVSDHHPSYRQNNTGKSGTASAAGFYHSYLRAAGYRWNGDPIDGMQLLTFKSPRGNLWRTADLVNTAYDYAVNAAAKWATGTVYAAGAKVNTDDGNVYQTTAGGVSGPTKPVGLGAGISDGTVLWNYLGPWAASRTAHYYDEDGYGGVIGQTSGRWGAETATKKGLSINADDASGDTYTRDDQRNVDHWRLSTTNGLQTGALMALRYGGALNGATPAISTNFHSVNNAAATNMTNLVLSAGQLRASIVYLYFSNGNTTVMNAGGNFNLKGNVNVTPAAGSVMGFLLEPTLSGGWIEVSRNF